MRVDPADAPPVETAASNQLADLAIRQRRGLSEQRVRVEHGSTPGRVAGEKLTVNKLVAEDALAGQQLVEVPGVRLLAGY